MTTKKLLPITDVGNVVVSLTIRDRSSNGNLICELKNLNTGQTKTEEVGGKFAEVVTQKEFKSWPLHKRLDYKNERYQTVENLMGGFLKTIYDFDKGYVINNFSHSNKSVEVFVIVFSLKKG